MLHRVQISAPRALLMLAALLAASLGGRAGAAEADWSGAWDSRWRDGGAELYLKQQGDVVTGSYPVLEGQITGDVRGRLLIGTWRDAGGAGRFTFAMAPDGRSFTGRFGSGEWWTGERSASVVGGAVVADASTPQAALRTLLSAGNAARDDRFDRLGPALAVLDFSELPAESTDTPDKRLRAAAGLFSVLDHLTFRVWAIHEPGPGETEFEAELNQAGTGLPFRIRFRYGVRPDGSAGWFIVVPGPETIAGALRLLAPNTESEGDYRSAHEALQSPRDTMRTFVEQYQLWQEGDDPSLLFRTMNLDRISPTVREDEAALRAQYLKEVIARVGSVVWQEIPDYAGRKRPYTFFVHPVGRVEVAPFETTDGGLIWQFTPETLDAARALFVALEDMPRDEGLAVEPSSAFLAIRNHIRALDRDLLDTVVGVEVWQWLALLAVLLVSAPLGWLVAWLIMRVVLRWKHEPDAVIGIKGRFIRPLGFLLVGGAFFAALRVIGMPETVDVPLRIAAGIVMVVAGGWLAYGVIDRLGRLARESTGRFRPRDEMLRSIVVAVAKVSVIVGSILVLAEVLAIPYQGVIAGLGIGGLAVALAARTTLENFIGGLTMLADKPVQVGDFCRFGDKLGTVEELGLRSVKIRSLERTLYSVPNGEFANMHIENFAKRDSILLKTVLQLRYETTPDQLRCVLIEIRKMLLRHPKVTAQPSRARFVSFGGHSLDIEIFAYVATSDYNDYLAIQEDVLLRLAEIVHEAGTGFAFPSTVNYLARDAGLDADRTAKAEATAERLRSEDRLPFPNFDEDEWWETFNKGEYPEAGSSDSRRARERRSAAVPAK